MSDPVPPPMAPSAVPNPPDDGMERVPAAAASSAMPASESLAAVGPAALAGAQGQTSEAPPAVGGALGSVSREGASGEPDASAASTEAAAVASVTTSGASPPREPAAPTETVSAAAPAFVGSMRLPDSLPGRVLAVASLIALAVYVFATMRIRLEGIWNPWSADGDQAQAVWHYWRYTLKGVFPPGDFLTDYAFAMHAPPVWWALMATLSSFCEPLLAAKILNVVAYLGGLVAIVVGVGRRSNVFVGVAAGFLLARNVDFHAIIAGGYARSFGPFLTMLFLGVFLAGRHRLALAVLVLQAALYPSVVIPCGLAYGAYTVVAGPMRDRLRRMAGMFIAGLLIIGFGKSQDFQSRDWWGPVVTLDEALQMPSWGPGGRVPEAPLRPLEQEIRRHIVRPLRVSGPVLVGPAPAAFVHRSMPELVVVATVVGGLAVAGITIWRRRRRESVIDPFPWQIPLLTVGMVGAYLLARALAFKLYLPYRPLQHVWPYVVYFAIPLFCWTVFVNLLPRRQALATALTVVVSTVPMFAVFGNGVEKGPNTYVSYSWNAPFFDYIKKLPRDAMVAGDFIHTSSVPLFAHHRVFVNKNLAHPFRKGFYAEAERRILASYGAIFATSLDDVVAFGRNEGVDYLAYRRDSFKTKDNRLYQPIKRELDALWAKNKAKGFALEKVPRSAVVFAQGNTVVVDMKKLAAAVERAKNAPPGTPPEPVGPPATVGAPPVKSKTASPKLLPPKPTTSLPQRLKLPTAAPPAPRGAP